MTNLVFETFFECVPDSHQEPLVVRWFDDIVIRTESHALDCTLDIIVAVITIGTALDCES